MGRDATQSGTAQDDKATSDKATSAVSTTDRTTNGEAMNDYAIGIDIGGTKVSGGVVDDRGRIEMQLDAYGYRWLRVLRPDEPPII